ncbi:C40 family peptidase [Paenibacillus thalictri]|nr:C40 family peptidase [Paenibacillus thalictri]
MRNRKTVMLSVAIALTFTSACAQKNEAVPEKPQSSSPMNEIKMQQAPATDYRALNGEEPKSLPVVQFDGIKYVSMQQLVEALQYQSDWDPSTQTYRIGDFGAEYEFKMNTPTARLQNKEVALQNAPVLKGNTVYIPVQAIADLFKEDMNSTIEDGQVVLHPSGTAVENIEDTTRGPADLEFADDPLDPFKTAKPNGKPKLSFDPTGQTAPVMASWNRWEQDAVPVMKNIDTNSLIQKAEQYLGVKYKFGTGPYPETGRFDCSTFTDYIFSKYGIDLGRTARSQSEQGSSVNRKSLRKGDLMFFYVPGRFKSNKTVGHVGIYMGDGEMIHACPKPKDGVQISEINTAYWQKTFLKAKRVAS